MLIMQNSSGNTTEVAEYMEGYFSKLWHVIRTSSECCFLNVKRRVQEIYRREIGLTQPCYSYNISAKCKQLTE